MDGIEEAYVPAGGIIHLMEEEQTIYDTPCEDNFHGVIYDFPPSKVNEIYKSLEDNGLQRIYHTDIKYIFVK